MGKLNQIIAIEKGVKSRSYAEITELHKVLQKPQLFNGFSKTYAAKDEDGESLPAEKQRAQYSTKEVLRNIARSSIDLFNITARKDVTNCVAKADIKVDGNVLLKDVPISHLLFLEKQVTDLRTVASTIPILDEGEEWSHDEHSGLYKTPGTQTHRTKKVAKPIVLYNATPEHPAQTQMITEDIIAGYWTTIKQSGAMPKVERDALVEKTEKLLRAVKTAREEANGVDEVSTPDVGSAIFNYLLGE